MEKFSSIERVVGNVSEEDKAEIIDMVGNTFKNQDFKHLAGKEKEKTTEELKIIELVNDATNEIRKKYGLEKFDIPSKNIHIIKREPASNDEDENSPDFVGRFESKAQRIIMLERSTLLGFSKTLFHEMLHFKSYNALQVANVENNAVENYRSGLQVDKRDYSQSYLSKINEAVTEELTKRFSSKLSANPIFAEEVEETKKSLAANSTDISGKPLPKDTYADVYHVKSSKFGLGQLHEYTYKKEREVLQLLIDRLLERNKTKFSSREEIFEIFVKGFMTGNILPIGRLIDETFGKGTLRKIGDSSKNAYKIVASF